MILPDQFQIQFPAGRGRLNRTVLGDNMQQTTGFQRMQCAAERLRFVISNADQQDTGKLAGQLRLGDEAEAMFRDAIVRPCMMPLITSQFMPRRAGDRPDVVPEGARNFACLGQYCEQKHDVVFTVEYSVRSAMTAVHRLAGGKAPPPVKRTDRNPIVIANALRTILAG